MWECIDVYSKEVCMYEIEVNRCQTCAYAMRDVCGAGRIDSKDCPEYLSYFSSKTLSQIESGGKFWKRFGNGLSRFPFLPHLIVSSNIYHMEYEVAGEFLRVALRINDISDIPPLGLIDKIGLAYGEIGSTFISYRRELGSYLISIRVLVNTSVRGYEVIREEIREEVGGCDGNFFSYGIGGE
jgi:hypothetical protein